MSRSRSTLHHARAVARGSILSVRLVGRLVRLSLRAAYRRFVAWLDARFFAWTVAYATHPLVILGTMLLLVPLIAFASATALVLILGNYTNVVSASVSSIVLMQGLKHHHENQRLHAENTQLHREHREQMAALHAKIDALTPTPPPTAPKLASTKAGRRSPARQPGTPPPAAD